MKLSRLGLLACTPVPLLLALTLPADDLSFHPAANAVSPKTLSVDLEMTIEDVSMTVDGQPMPMDDMGGMSDASLIMNMVIGVTETYVETKNGKPLVLRRTFDKLQLDTEFGPETSEVDSFKDAEGKTVEFKWDEEEGAYKKSFHESDGDEDELADLDVDMDLRALLPGRKVDKGDTWEVPASKLGSVFLPGGMIAKNDGEDEDAFVKVKDALDEQFSSALKEFKVVCTYKGMRDEDGANVGEIGLSYDGKMDLDLGSLIEDVLQDQMPDGSAPDIRAKLSVGMKGEGTLLWNPVAGRMHSFKMQADGTIDMDMGATIPQGDMNHEISMTGRAGGKINWSLTPGN